MYLCVRGIDFASFYDFSIKQVLKEHYEDLRNSLDLVGFTDEVSMLNYTYRINKQKDMSFKSHLHVSK
jgi:hypothetical protein